MSLGHVEQLEIVEFSFYLGRFENLKPHLRKDGIDGPQGLSADMEPTHIDWPTGEGDVDPLLQEGIPLDGLQRLNPFSIGAFQSGIYFVGPLACQGTFFSREFTDFLKDLRKLTLPPKVLHSPFIQVSQIP
jgi:hypothetical protein